MYQLFKAALLCAGLSLPLWSLAAPGEYWEITTKMDMPGMPVAMPATTIKTCVPKGAERDPSYTTQKECKVSDVKHIGNKTSWKMRCERKDGVMEGSGDVTASADQSEGTIRLSSTSGGRKMDMTQSYKSRRLGGSCDTEEVVQKAFGQLCDTSGRSTVQQIQMGQVLLDNKMCPGRKQAFCEAVRAEAPRDAKVYGALVDSARNPKVQVARECGVDMDASAKSLCSTLNGGNIGALSRFCPAEAKAYRELERRKACEGRSFTGHENLSQCLQGQAGGDHAATNAEVAAPQTTHTQTAGKPAPHAEPAANSNPAGALMDSAKKLKGLFGL
ncbi:DUF3617 domain-containing protein [Rhodoferax sp.]|uniref:DUF3617 domain-containing protein n=1 Tax=Rhodoferax sp. TaxID=50421 RepID=UPI00261ACC6F|nr:DUF3617 domain-containing protein [Rhodoferax sp.]MDD2925720.1 DUF3617 domain-containing protein [Rhodoferax sp.]